MCGIAGYIGNAEKSLEEKLFNGISYRGPDSNGRFVSQTSLGTLVLLHTRFSINDLSNSSNQPMSRNNITIVFNGEIFNYLEIRKELLMDGFTFVSNGEAEVIIGAYRKWGMDCFEKFLGFWAISLFDSDSGILILSRDRFGQKPLYYTERNGIFSFSSDQESLGNGELNKRFVLDYILLDRAYARYPSALEGVEEVKPGEIIELDLSHKLARRNYNLVNRFKKSGVSQSFETVFNTAVESQLISDVPVSLNLSGGLDSLAIAVALKKLGRHRDITAHTFVLSGLNSKYKSLEENRTASAACQKLGIRHSDVVIEKEDFFSRITLLAENFDTPVHSPAFFLQNLAWQKIAEDGFKVVLHGSANDELMFGYDYCTKSIDMERIRSLKFNNKSTDGANLYHPKNIGRFIKYFLKIQSVKELPNIPSIDNIRYRYEIDRFAKHISNLNPVERRIADFESLRIPFWNKVMDYSMMTVPIEVRVPYYDHNLVSWIANTDIDHLYGNGYRKLLLRNYIGDYLHRDIVWSRAKVGFDVPTDEWLKSKEEDIYENIMSDDINNILECNLRIEDLKNLDSRLLWRLYNTAIWMRRKNYYVR